VFTTSDLLRVNRQRLADAIDGISLAQVKRWQAIAELLEIDGMTLPVAEALHGQGLETMFALGDRSLSALRTTMAAIRAAGAIPAVPPDDELVKWMKDAVLLSHTGIINGTVLGPNRAPVAGASVSCMGRRDVTDARGRFRLRRLPLGRRLLVNLAQPNFRTKTVEADPVAPNTVVGQQFRLAARPPGAQPDRPRSEMAGDKLPDRSGGSFRMKVQDAPPSRREILRVVEIVDGQPVRLVSRMFDYDDGFVVRIFKMARNELPAALTIGEHVRFRDGRWQVADVSPQTLEGYRRLLRERRQLGELPANPTAADVHRFLQDWATIHDRDRSRS